jgi:diguanylate cyclase (GGDEF)-like protein/PAS domain S-box-containing protein
VKREADFPLIRTMGLSSLSLFFCFRFSAHKENTKMSKHDVADLINNYGDILASFFNHISDSIFLMEVTEGEKFRYVMVNPSAMRVAGLTEAVYGKLIEEVLPAEKAAFLNRKYKEAVLTGEPVSFVDHDEISGESILTPIFNSEGICTHVFSVTRDITERKKLEDQLHFMAYHDTLTGLPNRRLLLDRLQQAIIDAKRYHHGIGILYLDFDHFKSINDTYGHDVGDQFLQGLAERLKTCLRHADTIARLGGDEFVVLLTSIDNDTQVEKVARRIVETFQQPWETGPYRFHVTTSIGISLFPQDGEAIDELISHADKALYQAKAEGKNRYRFYHSLGDQQKNQQRNSGKQKADQI